MPKTKKRPLSKTQLGDIARRVRIPTDPEEKLLFAFQADIGVDFLEVARDRLGINIRDLEGMTSEDAFSLIFHAFVVAVASAVLFSTGATDIDAIATENPKNPIRAIFYRDDAGRYWRMAMVIPGEVPERSPATEEEIAYAMKHGVKAVAHPYTVGDADDSTN